MHTDVEFLIVGGGLAGLSCARALQAAGRSLAVLERSHRPGGRCASRRLGPDGPVLDFGPVFVHGNDPDFLDWLQAAAPELVAGWPQRVRGSGTPCQPEAFSPAVQRFALPSGLNTLAQSLGRDLPVHTGQEVDSLTWTSQGLSLHTAAGTTWRGQTVILATALEQSAGLLAALSPASAPSAQTAARKARALLAQFSSLPSLTVLAAYPAGLPQPDFDIWYPEQSPELLLISNEGAKRPDPTAGPRLVLQARSQWSAQNLDAEKDAWAEELLQAAARLLGPWAAQPEHRHAHRWKFSRLGPAQHLARPLVLTAPDLPGQLALTGDLFSPDGGLQGAWKAGRQLAELLLPSAAR